MTGSGPDAIDDQAWTAANQTITIDVLHNDTGSGFFTILSTSGAMNGTANVTPDGQYITYTPNSNFLTGTDTFEYVIDNGTGFTDTAYVTVTMAEVNDWSLEWRNPGDELWNASPPEEAVWSHEELRWTVHHNLPQYQTTVDFYAQDWDEFVAGGTNWTQFADGTGDGTPEGAGKGFGSPGVGTWAIKPVVGFEVPHQSGFGVAMADQKVLDKKGQNVAEITGIQWVPHKDTPSLAGTLEDRTTDAKFFPDATSATGPARNMVDVLIFVTPNIVTTIHLKAYDVDDPSDHNSIIDMEPAAGEPNGRDNIRTPGGSVFDFEIIASGETKKGIGETASLRVPFKINWIQPGNNYRVAATPRDGNDLLSLFPLAVSDDSGMFYDEAPTNAKLDGNDTIIGAEMGHRGIRITPRLTVWRTLHVETDWMAAPNNDEIVELLMSEDDPVPNAALPKPDTSLLESELARAFIRVEVGTNKDNQIDWDHNLEFAEGYARTDRGSLESPAYWVAHIASAYEGPKKEDGDNDNGPNQPPDTRSLLGFTFDHPKNAQHTPAFPDYSYVYRESLRDQLKRVNPNLGEEAMQLAFSEAIQQVVLHEIGHQFELAHPDPMDPNHVIDVMGPATFVADASGHLDPDFRTIHLMNIGVIRSRLQP